MLAISKIVSGNENVISCNQTLAVAAGVPFYALKYRSLSPSQNNAYERGTPSAPAFKHTAMGVPAFFRWLSRKYPNIIVHCVEEKGHSVDGNARVNVDTSKPNPNNVEFDNLYLDMNENKPAPRNEDEMMVAIFEYIDRIFSIVRPRRLLYMAIDGVAPRAKMNQQRSRRFRASKEAAEKAEAMARLRTELTLKGYHLPPVKAPEEHFDSNCITPGTPFMDRLAKCLHYYIHDRLNNDPGWRNIEVILSDANVPGEGEHKIMDFIRKQRSNPAHDPNTKHCLCGADADLIMLGLATHEPNFTIIREEFKPNQPKPCELCGQLGHEMKDCMGLPKEVASQAQIEKPLGSETEFIFIRLNVLKEYLMKDLHIEGLPFKWSTERAIDDWVFLCFFVGNDFLPHLPSLEIREGAIDRLVRIYKETIHKTKDYLTKDGFANISHCCMILTKLGEAEDEIFRERQINEEKFKRRQKERQAMQKQEYAQPAYLSAGQFAPRALNDSPSAIADARNEVFNQRRQAMEFSRGLHTGADLQLMLQPEGEDKNRGEKRKLNEEKEEPEDEVRLWEVGWKERYYESKFDVSPENLSFRHEVAASYAEGLCWVLHYYFQGCASWKWFFPYHYAPFASDFSQIGDLKISFEKGTKPFNPMEQLMSVFPAASRQHLPEPWGDLMEDPESPIIDFYPTDFRIDLNGKKAAWMGVALLPFVDEKRLLETVATVYDQLTPEERRRNARGDNYLFLRKSHKGYAFLRGLYENKSQRMLNDTVEHAIPPESYNGMAGTALTTDKVVAEKGKVLSPIHACQPIPNNVAVVVRWRDPVYPDDHIYPAVKLPGAKDPERVLRPEDLVDNEPRQWRPQAGMARSNQRAQLAQSGHRMVEHYANIRPPQNYGHGGGQDRGGYDGYQQHGGSNFYQNQGGEVPSGLYHHRGGGGFSGGNGGRSYITGINQADYRYSSYGGRQSGGYYTDSYGSGGGRGGASGYHQQQRGTPMHQRGEHHQHYQSYYSQGNTYGTAGGPRQTRPQQGYGQYRGGGHFAGGWGSYYRQ
ncbi:5'-3' exoribonuclease 2 homolog isoform X2 [Varroa destructor]|uniref:5'-3' exoribonuclease n=1 Tax=Varroa destructor TaxID=109461 RepID=A0A7M7KTI7_VARDE|nr:5'-3' exoribonuclease 2 homolog isoform X2 [Varroa destructor]